MSIEKEGASTQAFWLRMAVRFPIVGFTAVGYDNHEHGKPSHNLLLPENDGVHLVNNYLSKDELPHVQDSQIFAISSLMYLCPNVESCLAIERVKSGNKNLSFSDLEEMGAAPMAIVMADLDCPKTPENLSKIQNMLDKNYEEVGWSVFETDGSYHIVFNKFVRPEDLPKHFGEVINAFVSIEPEDRKKFFEEIGNNLIKFNDQPEKIREISQKLLDDIVHYDDPNKDGARFIVDLRWIAHSLLELLGYLETKKGGFAYLRISSKSPDKYQPKLISIQRIHKKINGKIVSYSLDD